MTLKYRTKMFRYHGLAIMSLISMMMLRGKFGVCSFRKISSICMNIRRFQFTFGNLYCKYVKCRKVESYRLSHHACLLSPMSLSSKKEMALPALEYFSGKQLVSQGIDTYTNTYLVFFSEPEGKLRVELVFDGDTVWTTQKRIAEIFQVDVRTVSYHINEILKSGDLNKYSVIQKTWITATEGKRYEANVYNLDMIIAVGYRMNSYKATRFR